MLPVRKGAVQMHNCYKQTTPPQEPDSYSPAAGLEVTRKPLEAVHPQAPPERGGPWSPSPPWVWGVPTLSVLLSPACSGVDSTQPPTPYVPVCIRGAERHPGNPPDRQRRGWGAPQAEAGPLGTERPLAPGPTRVSTAGGLPLPRPLQSSASPSTAGTHRVRPGGRSLPCGTPAPPDTRGCSTGRTGVGP